MLSAGAAAGDGVAAAAAVLRPDVSVPSWASPPQAARTAVQSREAARTAWRIEPSREERGAAMTAVGAAGQPSGAGEVYASLGRAPRPARPWVASSPIGPSWSRPF